jgi:hypothetical protein
LNILSMLDIPDDKSQAPLTGDSTCQILMWNNTSTYGLLELGWRHDGTRVYVRIGCLSCQRY